MIELKYYLENYDWSVKILFSVNESDIKLIEKELVELNCPEDLIDEALDNIYYSKYNVGFTYSNKNLNKSLIVISETDSIEELLNTLMHECYHLVNHISTTEDDEEVKADMLGTFILRISRLLIHLINSL